MNKTANRARHALPLLHILILLFIGGIGVHTLTSCSDSKDDDDPPSDTSSSSLDDGGSGTIEAVRIGDLTWMKRNLDTNVPGSKCYGEGGEVYDYDTEEFVTLTPSQVQANCQKYGRLYDWATAMKLDPSCNFESCSGEILPKHQGICPDGWRVPSNDDWDALYSFVEEENGYAVGSHLKSVTGWTPYEGIENFDTHGFSALPGGDGYSDGNFSSAESSGYWWSSTENEYDGYDAYGRSMYYYYEDAYWDNGDKSLLFSVRCVQD